MKTVISWKKIIRLLYMFYKVAFLQLLLRKVSYLLINNKEYICSYGMSGRLGISEFLAVMLLDF